MTMRFYTDKPALHVVLSFAIIISLVISSNINRPHEASVQHPVNTQGSDSINAQRVDNDAAEHLAEIEAAKAVREDALNRAAKYAGEENYPVAIGIIQEALNELPNDTELISQRDTLTTRYHEQVRSNAIMTAANLATSGDYEHAINEIETAISICGKDYELSSLYKVYADDYLSNLLNHAEAAFGASGYLNAISTLEAGLAILPDNQTILRQIESYQSYAPVSVDDLETWQTGDFPCGPYGGTVVDNLGNEYNTYYTGDTGGWGGASWQHYNVYRINEEYSKLTGKYCVKKEMNSISAENYFYVYGDDKLLKRMTIKGGDLPIEFSVDISGVTLLKIQSNDSCAGWGGDDVAFAADLFLWK